MKKSMLYAGLMTMLCTSVYAEENQVGAPANTTSTTQAPVASPNVQSANTVQTENTTNPNKPANSQPTAGLQASSDGVQTPTPPGVPTPTPTPVPQTPTDTSTAPSGTSTAPATQGITAPAAPATTTPAAQGTTAPATQGTTAPATQGTTAPAAAQGTTAPAAQGTTAPAEATAPPQKLDCNYRIPAETTHVDPATVMKWAEKAAEQSFDFNHDSIDTQLGSLKNCYTEQGWQGFNDALQKSGNLNAIQTQKLAVSSMVNGKSDIVELKDNQWKVTLPLQVVYQNDQEKLTQPLTINLVIGRKISGDLGIMQMIAIPRQTTATPPANTTPAETAPAQPDANTQNPS